MSISARGLLLVLVLGALFVLTLCVGLVQSVVTTHTRTFQVSFENLNPGTKSVTFDKSLSSLRALFPQPKANGLVPPPPALPLPELNPGTAPGGST